MLDSSIHDANTHRNAPTYPENCIIQVLFPDAESLGGVLTPQIPLYNSRYVTCYIVQVFVLHLVRFRDSQGTCLENEG